MAAKSKRSRPAQATWSAVFVTMMLNWSCDDLYDRIVTAAGFADGAASHKLTVAALQAVVVMLVALTAYEFTNWRDHQRRLRELPESWAESLARK